MSVCCCAIENRVEVLEREPPEAPAMVAQLPVVPPVSGGVDSVKLLERLDVLESQLRELRAQFEAMSTKLGYAPSPMSALDTQSQSDYINQHGAALRSISKSSARSKRLDHLSERSKRASAESAAEYMASLNELCLHKFEASVWDAAFFMGHSSLGCVGSILLCVILLVNLCIQGVFLSVVERYMLKDDLDSKAFNGLLHLRIISQSVEYLYNGTTLASRICASDRSLITGAEQAAVYSSITEFSGSGMLLTIIATICWLCPIFQELSKAINCIRALSYLPWTKRTHLEIVGSARESMAGGDLLRVSETLALASINPIRFLFYIVCVTIPRLAAGVALGYVGVSYIQQTRSMSDLFLNAIAMKFVLEVDEALFSALAVRHVRGLVENLEPLALPQSRLERWTCSASAHGFFKLSAMVVLVIAIFFFLTAPFFSKLAIFQRVMCSGDTNFVFSPDPVLGVVTVARAAPASADRDFHPDELAALRLMSIQVSEFRDADPMLLKTLDPSSSEGLVTRVLPGDVAFANTVFDKGAVRDIVALYTMSIEEMSQDPQIVCSDLDSGRNSAGLQVLRSVVGDPNLKSCRSMVASSSYLAQCGKIDNPELRFLCPVTCGCSSVMGPAGAFTKAEFGCPASCASSARVLQSVYSYWNTVPDLGLRATNCTDQDVDQYGLGSIFFFNSYVPSYVGGLSQLLRSLPTTYWDDNSLQSSLLRSYYPELDMRSVQSFFRFGKFHEDILEQRWNLAPGVPHPRGLIGCAYLTSWEITLIIGMELCNPKRLTSLRQLCPVACGCVENYAEGCAPSCL